MSLLQQEFETQIEGEVRFDKYFRGLYSTDASVYQIMPIGVVIPHSRADVIRTVQLCRKHGVSITARGAGTSQAGQAIGVGIQVDFSKHLNRLIELNPDAGTVRVEPGIVLDELNAILQPYDLHLPLDISTSDRATIGGMIANNSAGTRSVIYGKTLDYVLELTVVLSDGTVATMRAVDYGEIDRKSTDGSLEGNCYRVVKELAAEHSEEIRRRYPRILRRVGGYNLDEFLPIQSGEEAVEERPTAPVSKPILETAKLPVPGDARGGDFNLSRLMVGSEGTLGLVVEAKLSLVPLVKGRVVAVVHFHDLLEALSAAPVILRHQPSAVELVDRFILDSTKGKTEFEPLRDFIVGDPAAVLVVEFFVDLPTEGSDRVDRLAKDLTERNLGYHVHRASDADAQARIWKLRRAALGLSMSQRGDAKAISFVEDSAVSPQHLRDYIQRFIAILDEHNVQAGFYAHASVGLLHVRPIVDMKLEQGIKQFEQIATKISDLVLEFGGALSGEHGDGLVRSPFQQKMFGPKLYDAFCQIKRTFDPHGLFNPGKIVDAQPLTQSLRFGAEYETRPVDTVFDFSDYGGISRAAEQCGGVGACRKTLSGTMCPSYMATRNEADSTRGRANALRLAISGQLGGSGMTDPDLYSILDLCLECKACKSECPTGVDMPRLKSEFLYQYHLQHGRALRTRMLAHIEQAAVWGNRLAPASNWLAERRWLRWLGEKTLGLDRRRVAPRFARQTFSQWWSRNRRQNTAEPNKPRIAVFQDTFTNFFEPQHAIAIVRVADRIGYDVHLPDRVCCGRPLISKGLLDEAVRQATETTKALFPIAKQGLPIVFCEPSCFSAVRDDHPHLLRGSMREKSECVAAVCTTFEQWIDLPLSQLAEQTELTGADLLRSGPRRVLYHGHCHQKALTATNGVMRIFSRIPGCEATELNAGCCGMAGSFGYEKEHYDVSSAIGEQRLFPAVRETHDTDTVVASGFSCRHQIKHFTGVDSISTAILLDSLLAIPNKFNKDSLGAAQHEHFDNWSGAGVSD